MPASKRPRYIASALVCAVLALVVYRAKTQSFTIDEAFTFNLFIDKDLSQFALVYDACNHVLHTLLTKFVRYWLGTSELVLRLVSVAGALLYLIAARRLCRLAAGSGWAHVIGLAALALNPLVLDFMVAARGYGLAVGLFLWAIYYSVRALNEGASGKLLWRAGIAAGLSIGANLTLLVPATALGVTLLLIALRRRAPGPVSIVDNFGGPALVLGFLFLVLPLARSAPENFYLGTKSLGEAVDSLFDASFRYHEWRSPLPGCDACAVYGRQIAIPAAFLLLTAAGFGFLFFRDQRDIASDVMVLSTVTLALSVALLVALNRGFGAPFPFSRTGLYLIPLFTLSLLTAGGVLMRRSFQYGGHAVAGVLAAASLLYIGQWNTRYFSVWRFDAATNRLADTIAADRKGRELEPFTVASSKLYGETLKYYRKRRRLHAMAPDIPVADLEKTSADYYVLTPGERDLIGKLHLRVLLEDEFSGGIVARKS